MNTPENTSADGPAPATPNTTPPAATTGAPPETPAAPPSAQDSPAPPAADELRLDAALADPEPGRVEPRETAGQRLAEARERAETPALERPGLKILGPDGAPARPETPAPRPRFERDSPALVEARRKLFRTLQAIEAELVEASAAARTYPKGKVPRDLTDFIERLNGAGAQLAKLHAHAYLNTLGERYDSTQPLCKDAIRAAEAAGIKVTTIR